MVIMIPMQMKVIKRKQNNKNKKSKIHFFNKIVIIMSTKNEI